jgi:uncharacterized protein (UPF0303 family)
VGVIFLQNSPYKQLFCTAVAPIPPILGHERPHTRIVSVFGVQNWYLERTRSQNPEFISRKLMRVIFLHNSTYEQQLCTAVVLPARYLTSERPRTRIVSVFGAQNWYLECVRSQNQESISRKLMRVIFLHDSTYEQQLCTAVVLPARYLTPQRPRTRIASVFGAHNWYLECSRSQNQGIISRKLMRVIFLHNSTYEQQFCTAVVLPARYLTPQRPCTKPVHNGCLASVFLGSPTVLSVLDLF